MLCKALAGMKGMQIAQSITIYLPLKSLNKRFFVNPDYYYAKPNFF